MSGVQGSYEETGLLDDLTMMLDYTNEALIVVECYGGRLHSVVMRTLVLENLESIEDFAKTHAKHVGNPR